MYTFTLLLSVTFVSYAMYATITATLELYIRPMFSLLEYIIRSTLLCARRYRFRTLADRLHVLVSGLSHIYSCPVHRSIRAARCVSWICSRNTLPTRVLSTLALARIPQTPRTNPR